jgi:uncharacterized protein
MTAFAKAASHPITGGWHKLPASQVLIGHPATRAMLLARSDDATSSTVAWECTPGIFAWYYHEDETIFILGGHVVIADIHQRWPPINLKAGDTVYLPKGTATMWTVIETVTKIAFLRQPPPRLVMAFWQLLRRLKRFGRAAPPLSSSLGDA